MKTLNLKIFKFSYYYNRWYADRKNFTSGKFVNEKMFCCILVNAFPANGAAAEICLKHYNIDSRNAIDLVYEKGDTVHIFEMKACVYGISTQSKEMLAKEALIQLIEKNYYKARIHLKKIILVLEFTHEKIILYASVRFIFGNEIFELHRNYFGNNTIYQCRPEKFIR